MLRRGAAVAVLAAVATGCGGQKALPEYAGMNEWAARERAMEYLAHEARAEDNPFRGSKPRMIALTRGSNTEGDDAWIARFRDPGSGATFCLNLWAHVALAIRQYTGEWTDCKDGK